MENIEIEQAFLGCLLVENRAIYAVASKLTPEHFAEPIHAEIYKRIYDGVLMRSEVCNPLTLKPWASTNETLLELNKDAPSTYLNKLAGFSVSVIDAAQLAESIIRMWMLRQSIAQAQKLITEASDPDADPDTVIGKIHAELLDIRAGGIAKSIDSKQLTKNIINSLSEDLPIDSTGIQRLDEMMGGGLIQSKLYGFFARKKVGKTSFAVTLAHNLDKQGIKHAFICGEMGSREIHERFLARMMQQYPSNFRSKEKRESKFFTEKLLDAKDAINGCTRYYDAAGMTFDDLKGMISEAKYRYGVNGVILDYLQLVGGKSSKVSEATHLDNVSQWLAEAAKKYKIWIFALGQINQEGNTRGGEGIRLACDMCLELHRDDLTQTTAWLEMKDTRYTAWGNMGEKGQPSLVMQPFGQYFEQI